jgi:putative heme-binding domain-containing protein
VLVLLTSRPEWSMKLAGAVDHGDLDPNWVNLEAARQMKRHKNPELTGLVERLWPKAGRPASSAMEEQISRLAETIRSGSGDPYNGKKLFTVNCGNCHRLFHAGGAIGPDLTPFRRDDLDTVLLNIVNPSAEIREGYENFLVETRDDRALSGFVVRQDERVVVLRGLDGQDVVLRRDEITDLRSAGMSLMPEGLLEALDAQQVRDLFAYLRSSQPLAN